MPTTAVVTISGTLTDNYEDRFWARVERSDGCWLWTGSTRKGYGRVSLRFGKGMWRSAQAHRIAYQLSVGPIPEGLTLDHLCRNKLCVNPSHLEAVTAAENTMRGESFTVQKAAQTHCIHGHPFDELNTGWRRDKKGRSYRACKTCFNLRQRVRRERERAV